MGVNKYSKDEKEPIEYLKINFKAQMRQVRRLASVKRERNGAKAQGGPGENGEGF